MEKITKEKFKEKDGIITSCKISDNCFYANNIFESLKGMEKIANHNHKVAEHLQSIIDNTKKELREKIKEKHHYLQTGLWNDKDNKSKISDIDLTYLAGKEEAYKAMLEFIELLEKEEKQC